MTRIWFARIVAGIWGICVVTTANTLAADDDADAFDALRSTPVSVLELGLRDLGRHVDNVLSEPKSEMLSLLSKDVYMLASANAILIDVVYAMKSASDSEPNCAATLGATAKQILSPSDPSLQLSDPRQPGFRRIERMFESSVVGGGSQGDSREAMVVIRHIRFHVSILREDQKSEWSHCNARLVDL